MNEWNILKIYVYNYMVFQMLNAYAFFLFFI